MFKFFILQRHWYQSRKLNLYYPSTIKIVLHLNFAVPPYQGDQLLVVFSLPQCVPGKVDQSEYFIWSWQLENKNNRPVLSGSLEDPNTLVGQTFKKKKENLQKKDLSVKSLKRRKKISKKNLLVKPSVSLNNSPNWICSVPSGSLTWKFITFVFAICICICIVFAIQKTFYLVPNWATIWHM